MLFSHIISGKKVDLYQKDDPDWVPPVGLKGQQGGSPESTRDSMNLRYKRMIRTQQKQRAAAGTSAAAGGYDDNADAATSTAANDVDMINDDSSTSNDLSNIFCRTGTETDLRRHRGYDR